MGACETQVFEGVTRDEFNCLVARGAEAGIRIQGDTGEATHTGVTFRWQYTEVNQRLELQCMKMPPFVSCGYVNQQIHELVAACHPPAVA